MAQWGQRGGTAMPRPKQPLTARQELFIRMSARDESRKDILMQVFGLDINTASAREIHNADATMSRWRSLPEFDAVWKDEVRTILKACAGEAINVIRKQLSNDSVPWLQNKAANDLLNYGKGHIYGEEDKTIKVQVEGLPEIGSPDAEE